MRAQVWSPQSDKSKTPQFSKVEMAKHKLQLDEIQHPQQLVHKRNSTHTIDF